MVRKTLTYRNWHRYKHKAFKDTILKLCLKHLSVDPVKCRDKPCTWKGHMNIVRMSVLPKLINKFDVISRKILTWGMFVTVILKHIGKVKLSLNGREFLKRFESYLIR